MSQRRSGFTARVWNKGYLTAPLAAAGLAIVLAFPASTRAARRLQQTAAPGAGAAGSFDRMADAIVRNCSGCHFKGAAVRTIALDELIQTRDRALQHHSEWRRVYSRVVVARNMPPAVAMPAMPEADRKVIADWIEASFPSISKPMAPETSLRRLTNYEYNRSIRDIFGFDFDVEGYIQRDNVIGGLTNNGATAFASPDRIHQYLAASQFVSQTAIGLNDFLVLKSHVWDAAEILRLNPNRGWRVAFGRFVGDLLTRVQTGQREETPPDLEIEEVDTDGQETAVLDLAPKSRFALRHDFPVTANYMLTIRASGRDRRKPSVINVVVDGVPVPLAIDVSPSSRALSAYTRTIRMSRGVRSLVFTTPPRSRAYVASVEVIGPITPGGAAPLFPCVQLAASPSAESICAAQVVELIASRAFGGAPIGESERHALLAPYRSAADAGADFRTALSRAVQPILMDPRFLYRAGRQGEENDDYAFASRLSYFLWGSLPDDELRRIAARRALRGSPETIRAEIARLLRDPRADALVDAFGGGWLGFGSLRSHAVDARAFPEFSPGLREDMLTETRLYLETFFRENWPIRELMDSDTAFLNAALARHYGVEGVLGAEFRRLQLKGGNRRGLLNQGAILTLTSHSNGTSVVKRGLWVMEKTLCESVGEVPANVPALAESAERGLTLRRQMEKHRNNPVCASCHTKIDPLGFSLENYDAIGRWRTTDDGSLIDPSGALITHGRETAFKNVSGFRDALANDARFPACATRNLMAYALGRSLTDSDEAEIEDILERTKPRGHRIQDVITEIALSRAFRRP